MADLTNLTELRLNARTFRYGRHYPFPPSSLWPGIVEPEEIAKRYILLMSSLCPSLQYVMVGDRAWQICRPNNALRRYPTRRSLAVELRRLDFDEIRGMELFALTEFADTAGLLEPTHYRDELEDDERPIPHEVLDILGMDYVLDM